jgi:hypothetical protein
MDPKWTQKSGAKLNDLRENIHLNLAVINPLEMQLSYLMM